MPTNYDQYKTGEHDSQSPMNRKQLPPEPTLIEQLQFEVDELNGKLREVTELKEMFRDKYTKLYLTHLKAYDFVVKIETLELRQGFKITGATLNDGLEYRKLKERLFNLIRR